ncbi:MAG TPA: hypothetical protein VHA33_15915 [Candidatus Angelobacter sp.]|nr:hypothetical protein [Candidatus Angelobacter sp.]
MLRLVPMRFVHLISLLTTFFWQSHSADHPVEGAIPLRPTTKVNIPAESNRPVYKPARCDARGEIYFRGYQVDDRRVPVVRTDTKGQTVKYSLDSDASLANGTAYDFSVLPNGNLYQAVQVGEEVYVVAFDQDGRIKQRVRLEKRFWVARAAALSDTAFLAIGTEIQPPAEASSKQPPKLFMAIFDEHGQLVRPVVLDPSAPSDGPDEKLPILAALSSDAQAGMDGNLYLLLRTSPPTVYALDSAGRIMRSFKVLLPAPKMNAISFSLDKDRMAILFREQFRGMQHNDAGIITVVDASMGVEVARYSAGPDLGATLACYHDNDFVFLGRDKENLALQHAAK